MAFIDSIFRRVSHPGDASLADEGDSPASTLGKISAPDKKKKHGGGGFLLLELLHTQMGWPHRRGLAGGAGSSRAFSSITTRGAG